jgi:hypothetical protein
MNINQGNKDYKKIVDRSKLTKEFKKWHKKYNHYDYKLYEEFC